MTAAPDTSPERLSHLLRLLDDDSPPVRESVAKAIAHFDGDVSEMLAELGELPAASDLPLLSRMLLPARRERLRREWVVPTSGAEGVADDWDLLESLLRIISDYLHDGVTLRQSLGDALDTLAEEAENVAELDGAAGLNDLLFKHGRLKANLREEDAPANYDLARAIAGDGSNGLGLGLIFLLLAKRLDLEVDGVNLPQSFLCRFQNEGQVMLVEPAAKGKVISPEDLAHRIRRYPREIRATIARPTTPGELLVRLVEELATARAVRGETEDAELMEDLLATLVKPPF